ncbi:TPA: DNA-processing protein DprA [Bacillus cereus]
MISFENYEQIKEFIANEVLITSEATKFLNISSQRLHQLIQSGKLVPIKTTKSGSLFLKKDLEERKDEIIKAIKNKSSDSIVLQDFKFVKSEVVQEAVNYFTIHYLCKHSDKKTREAYLKLEKRIDTVHKEISECISDVSNVLEISEVECREAYNKVIEGFNTLHSTDIIVKKGEVLYPDLLIKTDEAPPFLFMRGNPDLLNYPAVSIVGARKASEEGQKRAKVLAELLGTNRIVVASGLAKGIDRAAHLGALNINSPTIAVIGTPISKYYPKENEKIQKQIENEGLIISKFAPTTPVQRWNFPMRNAIMSGISLATVIVEASETSGSLIQADYALKQKRIVFIPQSAIDNPLLKWPQKYINRGACKFSTISDLVSVLKEIKSETFNDLTYPEQISIFEGDNNNVSE